MDQRSLYFRGDIHGDFKRLATRLSLNDLSNATITQVADFGIGFNPDERKDLKILNKFHRVFPPQCSYQSGFATHSLKGTFGACRGF